MHSQNKAKSRRAQDASAAHRRTAHNFRDLTGRQFSRLKVLKRAANDRLPRALWLCVCECGNQTIVAAGNLTTGTVRSCGCLRKEILGQTSLTHGMTGTSAYNRYSTAKQRCQNPKNHKYAIYGGRGIKFLYESFEEFFADLGDPPPGHSLERIDNDGHYEPGNCRWATPADQNNNRRDNVIVSAFGRTRTLPAWAREFHIRRKLVWQRIKNGWPAEKALMTTPRVALRNGRAP